MTRKIFIDCGTHLGMGFSKCAKIFNIDHNWEIFGFEANPYVFDGYVKNIQSEKYPGYGGAVKYGLNFVNTKYFCWLDGDGETDPSYLENMYKIVLENQNINIVNASRFKNKNIIFSDIRYLSINITIKLVYGFII